MSSHPHFPIISTTPPPLDINDDISEDETEDDFGSFNNQVLPENHIQFNNLSFNKINIQDIDFNNKNNDCIRKESFDTKIDENNGIDQEIKSHNSINNITDECDNEIVYLNPNNDESIDKISLKSIEFPEIDSSLSLDEPNREISINSEENSVENDLKLQSDKVETIESLNNSSNDSEVDEIEEQESADVIPGDKLEDYAKNINDFEDDCDFADFTSFRLTESEETVTDFESGKQSEKAEFFSLNNSKSETSFGDFNSNSFINSNAFNNFQSNDNELNIEESDDDFADFASAEPVQQIDAVFNSNDKSLDLPQNDGEFADFASFKDDSNELEFQQIVKQESTTDLSTYQNKLSALFADIFPASETVTLDENSLTISRDLFENADQNSKNLWKSVQNLEDAPSLKLRWLNSHSFQLLLAALKIDPRNILRNSSVPMFASGLGCVLEPTKHTLNSDFNNDNSIDQNENGTDSTNNTQSSIPTPIPPVQFDWSSSGLTNPLDANQKSMASFDLDFFVTNDDVQNINKQIGISSFEEELLNDKVETNSKSDSISRDLDSINDKIDIVQQLLSSVKSSSTSTKPISDRNQVLSAEALQVLDELPNLSFMRAKVLMFPIMCKNSNI